jgi:hypothetical protein
MLVSTGALPSAVTVTVDGEIRFEGPLEASVVQVRLGPLSVDEHTLHITASRPLAAYMNHLGPPNQAAYLQRFCVLASTNTLEFPYIKREAGEELLALRILSLATSNGVPFQVRLELRPDAPRGVGPFPELTTFKRDVRVTPQPGRSAYLVAGAPARLDEGQAIFLSVGPDVPPGAHTLKVKVAADAPRWVSLSRTTPGLESKLRWVSNRRYQ